MSSPTDSDTDADRTEGNRTENSLTSRRTLLKTTAVVGVTTMGLGGVALAQSGGDALQGTTIKLGGEVAGWQGNAPSSIEGKTNPTLTLKAGTSYTVTWTNLDGQPHNFQVMDSGGNVLHKTEIMSDKGSTQSTSFKATKGMAQYNCVVHPSSMVGDVNVQGQSQSGGNGTNQSSGNGTNQSAVRAQETNVSTNESGGLGKWNVTANGSAEPEVVDNTSAITNATHENAQSNETEQVGNETEQVGNETEQGGNETEQGGNGKAKTGNGKAKTGSGSQMG